MSRWKELFDNHAIHETFKWLRDSVSTDFDDIDDNEVIEKRRFLKLLSKYEEILQNIDPELLPFNQLDSLNTAFRNQFATHIDTYKNNGNVANLVAANDLFTNQLTPLSLFLGMGGSSEPSDLVFQELEGLIDSTSQVLITKKDSLIEEIKGLSSTLEENEQRLIELSQHIEQKKSEVDTHISEWQSQFSTAQESRSQDYNQWRDGFYNDKNEDVENEIKSYKEALDNSFVSYKEELDNILKDGNVKHNKILELYQITADDSVGASFLKNAKDEKEQANIWRKISISFIIATVFWMLFAYSISLNLETSNLKVNSISAATSSEIETDKTKVVVKNPSKESNSSIVKAAEELPWYKLFITFSLSGVLLWGSAYAAQQSTKHRKNEKQAMWFALEVRAIDPFISTLEPEDRNELKKQFSQKLFGQFSDKEGDSTVIDEHVFKMITDTIGNVISKATK